MAAGARACDLAEPAPQGAQISRAACGDLLDLTGYPIEAEPARPALTSRLVSEIAHHPGGFGQAAHIRGHGATSPAPTLAPRVARPADRERQLGRLP